MINTHKVKVQKTAHYYSFGDPGPAVKHFWIVCHGYGQLASRIIHKFREFDPKTHFVIAPEGFSRFYWQGFSGDVGASWMTKADRLDEIADFCQYLQQLYDHFTTQLPADVTIHLMGFSQGCATQVRWIHHALPHFHRLILWAGLLPEDLDYKNYEKYFKNKEILFVYGSEDQFITKERLEEYLKLTENMPFNFKTITFEGKHEVQKEVLLNL